MFYVVNKDKIVSCLMLFTVVLIMFFMASALIRDTENTVEAAGKARKELPIYNVNIEEAIVANDNTFYKHNTNKCKMQ